MKKRQKEQPKNLQRETRVFFPHSEIKERIGERERERKNDYNDDAAIPERQFRHLFLLLFF